MGEVVFNHQENNMLGMEVYTFNSSTQETESDKSLWVQSQIGLHKEFQANKDYIVRICHKKGRIGRNEREKILAGMKVCDIIKRNSFRV